MVRLIQPAIAGLEKSMLALSPCWRNLYFSYYRRVVEKEVALARLTSQDQILNVGCGGVPLTALLLARLTGAAVWAIDRDREAVHVARSLVRESGLEAMVRVLEADGTGPIPCSFHAAVVALQAEPKALILHNLLAHGKPGVRLVIRQPKRCLYRLYDHVPETYKPEGFVKHSCLTFDRSLLFSQRSIEHTAQ